MSAAAEATGPMATEPARVVGLVTGVVTSVVALLVALGIDISPELTTAILGLLATLGPIVAGFVIRSKVYSPETVREMVKRSVVVGLRAADGQGDSGATLA